ncbi:hypothetical protein JX265_007660 [Neoarthrinium moseri]|uniref:LITAF domain-containing protein n=1 Tax=Neoarthrinium moseri TaxID=1658444 RepID=A0A9P9WJW6_9PEZI|nr:uncharacterized protein JN550_012970 [Neoarthrinium moseri]KAI1857895.1 hypothetical protein JN550_012970 [Neoarthrinium moseri]KAI1867084.1 hypothetical protein JX265_007660 [Neoarthrinium moseri]
MNTTTTDTKPEAAHEMPAHHPSDPQVALSPSPQPTYHNDGPHISQPQSPYQNDAQHVAQPQPTYQGNGQHDQNKAAPQQTHMVHPTPLAQLGAMPALIDCPFCSHRGPTRVDEHSSSTTILAGIGIGCLCICLACLPCMLHWFYDVDHYCTHCNQRVCFVPNGGIPQPVHPQQGAPQHYVMGPQPQYGAQTKTQEQQQQAPRQYS